MKVDHDSRQDVAVGPQLPAMAALPARARSNPAVSASARALLATGGLTDLPQKLRDLERAVIRSHERFAAVLEIGAAISAARDYDALLELAIDRITRLLSADAATLFLLDPERNELWSKVLRGSRLQEIRLPVSAGIAGHVFRSGETVLLADAYADARFDRRIDRASGFKTRSMIAAPLRHVSGRILGVVEVLDREVSAFTEEDTALVEAIGAHVAAVLDNLLLTNQLRRQNATLDLLYRVEQGVSSSAEQSDLLDRILGEAMAVIGAGAGSILLADPQGGRLYFRSARGEGSRALSSLSLRAGQGIAGQVALTGEAIIAEQAARNPHYDPSVARKLGVTVGAVLCVPLRTEAGVLGALELLNKPGGFTDADLRLATLLASQTARAVAQQHAREEKERKARLETIGQMLADVVHDLRTPLTIIRGFADLMALEPDHKERRQLNKEISRQVDQLAAMTKETLAFARGERQLLIRRTYLHRFLADVEAYLRREFEGTGIRLVIRPGFCGVARLDENKMKRVVTNMARNAAQAMKGKGTFTFGVDLKGKDLVFRFQDDGPGIAPEIQDRLFQSFTTTRKGEGTGLGLAIVKKIAEQHGGSVAFRTRPGRGTTFEVRVPART